MPDGLATESLATQSLALLAAGGLLLFFGRRLFWLFIAVAGFLAGAILADIYVSTDAEATRWIVALLCGGLASLAAIFLQKIVVSLGGAVIAAYGTWWYLGLTWAPFDTWQWLVVVVSGIAGLLLARLVFDIGLVALSALAGAVLVLEGVGVGSETSRWLLPVLIVVGGLVQLSALRKRPVPKPKQ